MAARIEDTALFTDPDLVSYYKLENTADSVGANTLTNVGSLSFVSAKYNNGADLGSTNTTKWLKATGTYGIVGSTNISIVGWVNLYSASGAQAFFSKREDTSVIRYLIDYDGTTLNFRRLRDGTADEKTTYIVALSIATWYHVGLTWDGTNIKGYVNGSLTAPAVAAAGNDGIGVSENAFRIGTTIGDASPTSGIFDDVGVFKRALTAGEVALLGVPDVTENPIVPIMSTSIGKKYEMNSY